jgi:hypothetical protein
VFLRSVGTANQETMSKTQIKTNHVPSHSIEIVCRRTIIMGRDCSPITGHSVQRYVETMRHGGKFHSFQKSAADIRGEKRRN